MAKDSKTATVLIRPRLPGVQVGAAFCSTGLAMVLWGRRRGGRSGAARVVAGAVVAILGPVSFWYWSRIRTIRLDGQGIHLRGLGVAVTLPWAGIEYVRSERIGPTTFLVAKASSDRPMPLFSPFRNRLASLLGVPDSGSLLVVRTVDFTGGPTAFGGALSTHSPATVPVDWR